MPALGSGDDIRGISGVTTHAGEMTFVLDVRRFGELTDGMVADGSIRPSGMPSALPRAKMVAP